MRGGSLLLLAAAVAACGDSTDPGDDPVPTTQVAVVDNAFEPSSIVVDEGQTVTWTWAGNDAHSVILDDPLWTDSQIQLAGGTHAVTFTVGGTYTYFCSVHGRAVMAGSVVVTAQQPQP